MRVLIINPDLAGNLGKRPREELRGAGTPAGFAATWGTADLERGPR